MSHNRVVTFPSSLNAFSMKATVIITGQDSIKVRRFRLDQMFRHKSLFRSQCFSVPLFFCAKTKCCFLIRPHRSPKQNLKRRISTVLETLRGSQCIKKHQMHEDAVVKLISVPLSFGINYTKSAKDLDFIDRFFCCFCFQLFVRSFESQHTTKVPPSSPQFHPSEEYR